ncbi:hypothetical protein WICPIJ_005868 [Wickerhamomyces pijperi]|uniref:Uncharacterized protein n=1 Tax=Wickerhamomyces pijperi TaxID=599730 RepID=A0A9P8Q338_WICPI|nr:hypothetical protein WICPIJ_005868 [Wickerhamomyces pijperi]
MAEIKLVANPEKDPSNNNHRQGFNSVQAKLAWMEEVHSIFLKAKATPRNAARDLMIDEVDLISFSFLDFILEFAYLLNTV